ncbi:hypothetical protein D9M72_312970 [compost metagenome]
MIWAESQWVSASIGTSMRISDTCRTASVAPFSWPDTTRMSGLSAFTLASVTDMSFSSGGSFSSITTCMPRRFASSATPSRTSCEKLSFSMAMATLRLFGDLPARCASSAASWMAERR